ncbi:hypothetical protein [Polyangium sp. 6x1]|uniref:hypothetical protein n=1 Tax=Polyangium sp. 6x1 TaxID=3042689 RepID=UPI0024832797|nr:hypothetical protein [Polyangium sp. 6x1]MDI1450777.1 hypothetical protein [Polyangium sp. 6x1]
MKILGVLATIAVATYPSLGAAEQLPVFIHNFYADGDPGQCNGAAYGKSMTSMGQWTPTIRFDTDGRSGGCYQQFSVYDPAGVLEGLTLQVEFYPDGREQCDNPGLKTIPIHGDVIAAMERMSDAYRVDTDNRAGGCQQRFILEGRDDIALDVSFYADGNAGQCGNQGTHTVTAGRPVTLRLDMDNRSGGCRQSFRLRKIP